MEQKDLIFLFIFVLLCFVLLLVVMTIMRNPFQFPYMTIYIDISGKRNVKAEDYIDRYLINNKFDFIKLHEEKIKNGRRIVIIQYEVPCWRNTDKSNITKFWTKGKRISLYFRDCKLGIIRGIIQKQLTKS